jgi:hypothetical protein
MFCTFSLVSMLKVEAPMVCLDEDIMCSRRITLFISPRDRTDFRSVFENTIIT